LSIVRSLLEESRRSANWQETLGEVWKLVEQDIGVPKIFTAPHEPTFPEGSREFLTRLGYAPDAEYPLWWSKNQAASERMSITPPLIEQS